MASERDIYRTANLLIQRNGIEAERQAAARVDELIERSDLDGQRTWTRIIKAIEELTSTDRGDAPLN